MIPKDFTVVGQIADDTDLVGFSDGETNPNFLGDDNAIDKFFKEMDTMRENIGGLEFKITSRFKANKIANNQQDVIK